MYINFHLTNKVLEDGAYCVVKLSIFMHLADASIQNDWSTFDLTTTVG